MLNAINDKILEKLETLKGSGKPLVEVKDYHTLSWEYPYATFELVNIAIKSLDNCSAIRIFQFDILVFQSILEDDSNRDEAKANIYYVFDDIFELFDKDETLGGLADAWVNTLGGNLKPFITQTGKALVGRLELQVKVTYNTK